MNSDFRLRRKCSVQLELLCSRYTENRPNAQHGYGIHVLLAKEALAAMVFFIF